MGNKITVKIPKEKVFFWVRLSQSNYRTIYWYNVLNNHHALFSSSSCLENCQPDFISDLPGNSDLVTRIHNSSKY